MLASTEPFKIPRMAEITWQCVRYVFSHVSRRVVSLCSTAFCHEKDILEGLGLGVCSGFLTLADFCAFRPVPDSQENAKEWRANSWDFRNAHVLHESTCRPAGSRHSQKQAWQAPCQATGRSRKPTQAWNFIKRGHPGRSLQCSTNGTIKKWY